MATMKLWFGILQGFKKIKVFLCEATFEDFKARLYPVTHEHDLGTRLLGLGLSTSTYLQTV